MKTKRIIAGFVAFACLLLAFLTLSRNASKTLTGPGDSAEVARIMLLTNVNYRYPLSDSKMKELHCGIISGRVTDKSTGLPMSDDLVRAYDSHCKDSACIESTLTDSHGGYVLAVPTGQETVLASSITRFNDTDKLNMKMLDIAVADRKTVNLVISTSGQSSLVAGVVYGPDGKPFPGATVAIYNQQYHFPTNSGTDGRFSFEEPGLVHTAQIYAVDGDMATITCANLTHGPNVTLRLVHNAACSIAGTVLDNKHNPVAGAVIELFMRNHDGTMFPTGELLSDAHGKYNFPSLCGTGNYILNIYHVGFIPWQTRADILAGIGKKLEIAAVTLQPGTGSIAGSVVNPYGAPVPGAAVNAEDVEGRNHHTVLTDPSGKFYIGGFQGRYIAISVTTIDDRFCNTTVTSGRNNLKLRVMNSLESAAIVGRN